MSPVRCAALLVVVASAAACGSDPPLRVGTNIWPGYEPLYIARSLGYYDGHAIELLSLSSAADVKRAYRSGAIDVAALTADEALDVAETLPAQRLVLVCDVSAGADALLVRPPLASVADIKGRRVGVEANALGAFMLARALAKAGMKATDVTVVPVLLEEHEQAYAKGTVDAIVTFDPHRTHLIAAGARVVFDSSEIPGEIIDVLMTHRALVSAQDAAVAALVRGWFQALDYLKLQPEDAAQRVAAREQQTPDAFLASLRGLSLPDREENQRMLGRSAGNLSRPLRQLSAVMMQNKLLGRETDPAALLDDHFVR
jgi:NitT/TauT family transport system substrate-binding protein